MTTILLHGDNPTSLVQKLEKIKEDSEEQGEEIISLDAHQLSSEAVYQATQSASVFSREKTIILENASQLDPELPWSGFSPDITKLVLKENKKLSAGQISVLTKLFPDLQVFEFKQDLIVFKFLDSLAPLNQKGFFPLWLKYRQTEAPEIILVMIVRQLRLCLIAKSDDRSASDEFSKLSPWQKQKIDGQSRLFNVQQLKFLLGKLSQLDYLSKSGQNPSTLASSLELFLLSI